MGMDDPINPLGGLTPAEQVEPRRGEPEGRFNYQRTLRGRVIAVHRKTPRHPDGHVLDATVGEESQNEIVIAVEGSDLDNLVGQTVSIRIQAP